MSKSFVLLKNVWPDNMGNAFIDIGALLALQKAFKPDCRFHSVSLYPIMLFATGTAGIRKLRFDNLASRIVKSPLKKLLGREYERIRAWYLKHTRWKVSSTAVHALNLSSWIHADYVVIPGKVLTIPFLQQCSRVFHELKSKPTRLVFLGVGGAYSKDEIKEVRRLVKEIRPYVLVSRDEIAYEKFQDLAEYAYSGIDCAFFINELPLLEDMRLEMGEYVTLCFDRMAEPEIGFGSDLRVVRTSHYYDEKHAYGRNPRERFWKPNMLVSDSPIDYLTVYKHTRETHSDRNHACVVTLCFGKPAKLYGSAGSIPLFARIGSDTIGLELTFPDISRIESEKEKMMGFLSDVLG